MDLVQTFINATAFLVSGFVAIFLLYLSSKTKLLKGALTLIALGVMIAILLHALFELFENFGLLELTALLLIMPLFVTMGSILIIVGCISILRNVINPITAITETILKDATGIEDLAKRRSQDNEIGTLLKAITDSRKELEEMNRNLDDQVKKKTIEMQSKNDELIKTLEDFYTIRIGLVEDMERGELEKENQLIRERLDTLKNADPV